MTINGWEDFKIDADCASYHTNSAWKGRGIRKDENRNIKLTTRGYKPDTIFKITFNKEYDANKLRAKINEAIQGEVERKESIKQRLLTDNENTVAIANNYILNNPNFNHVPVSNIVIHEGKIKFYIDNCGCFEINANGDFSSFHLDSKEIKNKDDFSLFYCHVGRVKEYVINMHGAIIQRELSQELQEWAKTAHNRTYHVKEKKYSQY